MDFSDKIIIFCIIFLILAILSVIFNCYKFNKKSELFKNKTKKEKFELPKAEAEAAADAATATTTEAKTVKSSQKPQEVGLSNKRRDELNNLKKKNEPFTSASINKAVEEFFNKSDEKFMEYMKNNKDLFNNEKFIEKMSQQISKKLTNKKN